MTAIETTLYHQASNATWPWAFNYDDSHDRRLDRHKVSQKEIDICLECPFAECINCLRYKKHRFAYLAKIKEKSDGN